MDMMVLIYFIVFFGCIPGLNGQACSPGWFHSNATNRCYIGITSQMTWTDAKSNCESLGASLASSRSPEERDVSHEVITSQNGVNIAYWIGGNDVAVEGSWVWVNGDPVGPWTNWNTGEPNGGVSSNCMILLRENGSWRDRICSNLHRSICSKPATCSVPTHVHGATYHPSQELYIEGQVLTYTCNKQYTHVSGDVRMTCIDSVWNGTLPVCQGAYLTVSQGQAMYVKASDTRIVGYDLSLPLPTLATSSAKAACSLNCLAAYPECRSYNVRELGGNLEDACVLNNVTLSYIGATPGVHPGWSYYEINY